jgi:hypothetical protein
MLISQLIKELEKIKREYGDVPVGQYDYEYTDWVNNLEHISVKTLQNVGKEDSPNNFSEYYDGYSKHHKGYHPENRKTVLII